VDSAVGASLASPKPCTARFRARDVAVRDLRFIGNICDVSALMEFCLLCAAGERTGGELL